MFARSKMFRILLILLLTPFLYAAQSNFGGSGGSGAGLGVSLPNNNDLADQVLNKNAAGAISWKTRTPTSAINLRDHLPDGYTEGNDIAADIQTAMDDVCEDAQTVLHIPDGQFSIEHNIYVPRFCTIQCVGGKTHTSVTGGTRLVFEDSGIHFDGDVNGSGGQTFNNGIEGCTMVQNDSGISTTTSQVEAAGQTVISLSAIDNMRGRDTVRIVLDDASSHITTIASSHTEGAGAGDITIDDAIPVGRQANSGAVVERYYPTRFLYANKAYSLTIKDNVLFDINSQYGVYIENDTVQHNLKFQDNQIYGEGFGTLNEASRGIYVAGGESFFRNNDIEDWDYAVEHVGGAAVFHDTYIERPANSSGGFLFNNGTHSDDDDNDSISVFGTIARITSDDAAVYVFNQAHDVNIYGDNSFVEGANAWFVDTTNNCAHLDNINFYGVLRENFGTANGFRDGLSCVNVYGMDEGGSETLSGGTASVTFDFTQPDTNYQIQVSCDGTTVPRWSSKATTGFTITAGTTDNCDWRISRLSN